MDRFREGHMLKFERSLTICIVTVGALAACRATNLKTAQPAPAAEPPPAQSDVIHTPWSPLHKGGADLSTGVYGREDDDLVVNTPMPIVLRRTYNSGDGHSRQFGVNT